MGRAPSGLEPLTVHLCATENVRSCTGLECPPFPCGSWEFAVFIIRCSNRLQVKLSQLKTALFKPCHVGAKPTYFAGRSVTCGDAIGYREVTFGGVCRPNTPA